MKPKLSSKTPDALESNALIELHDTLRDDFGRRGGKRSYIALIEFSVPSILQKVDGDVQANLVIQHIEVATGTKEQEADALFTRIWRDRTGATGARPTGDSDADLVELDGLDEDDEDDED